MSVEFLTTSPDMPDMRLAVEVAWGADITDLTGVSWVWDDISQYVILEQPGGAGGGSGEGGGDPVGGSISIDLGRPDFSQETQTATMTLELDNRDGRFSEGGLSPYWPNIRRGTPVRVRVSPDGGSTWFPRFQGQANGFTPNWPEQTGRWATVTLSASGPLRKLNQGTLPARSVYTTEIPRSAVWPDMLAYWPCEGGDGFRPNPSAYPEGGHPELRLDTQYTPRAANNPSNEAFPMSGPIQSHMAMYAGAEYIGGDALPAHTVSGVVQVRLLFAIPGALPPVAQIDSADDKVQEFPGIHWQPLFYLTTNHGTTPTWAVQINDLGDIRVLGYNSSEDVIRTGEAIAWGVNGIPFLLGVIFTNSGSSINVQVRTKKTTGTNNSFTWNFSNSGVGTTVTGISLIGPDCSGRYEGEGTGTENVLIAHASLHLGNHQINTTSVTNLLQGLPGETVTTRLTRLCGNHGIALDVLDSTTGSATSITDTVGGQYYDTLTNLLRETERTGQGLLYDGLGPGLTYVSKKRREANAGGPATLVLDAAQANLMEPFTPVDDDQLTINHCDVTIRNGTAVTYIDADGAVGADAIGDYATSLQVNPQSDVGLIHYAQWIVGLGTQQGYRYPSVSFALETNPELIDGWLACTPTSRIDVENITAIRRQHAPETIKLLVEGWHEEIDAFTWRVTANTSPAAPWNVITAAAATGSTGDSICHLDTDGSQLNANAAEGATSISVRTNSGPRWVTAGDVAEGGADNFPFDLDVGGCKVTVTAVSGTTSPQTFTLADPLPRAFTGSTTPGAGTPVKVWRPPVLGL